MANEGTLTRCLETPFGTIHYHYRRAKLGQVTIVVVPAFGWDTTYGNFKHLLDQLPLKFGWLAVDTIGTGVSITSFMDRTLTNILMNLHLVIAHEQLTNVFFVGHSLGGDYAWLYAQRYSGVRGLLLIEPPYAAMAAPLMTEIQALIVAYPRMVLAKQQGKFTVATALKQVCPLNAPHFRQQNAQILWQAYANPSVLTEAQHMQELITAMQPNRMITCNQVTTLVTTSREREYQQSPFARLGPIVPGPGNHYLHWSNEPLVLTTLLRMLATSI